MSQSENNMEKDNSTNNIEQKKWMVSRIDLYHKLMAESIEVSRISFGNLLTKKLKVVKGFRNGIFAILGIVLTIILSLNATEPGLENFYVFLAIISVVGLVTYLISYLLNLFINAGIDLVNFLVIEQFHEVTYSQGFVSTHFFKINEITEEEIDNYMNFTQLLALAVLVNYANEIQNFKDVKIEWLKNMLKTELDEIFLIGKEAPKFYNKLLPEFQILTYNIDFIKKALSKYIQFDETALVEDEKKKG